MRFQDDGLLTEMPCKSHVAYLLHDVNAFYPTGFEVLQNMDGGGFLRCVKMQFNAQLQFVYLTCRNGTEYKPMVSLLNGLHPDGFLRMVRNLLEVMQHVEETGFLGVQNIVLSPERIYVDPATMNVQLIYLPIAAGYVATTTQDAADELCAMLLRIIYAQPELENAGVRRLRQALASTMPTLRQLYSAAFDEMPTPTPTPQPAPAPQPTGHFTTVFVEPSSQKPQPAPAPQPTGTGVMLLQAVQHTEPLRIALPKCDLLAGTRVGAGELELHGNPYISGRHCKFSYQNGQYYLTDIGSSNGTYLNGQMLPRDVPQALQDGDTITIATSVFRVMRQEGGGMR